MAHWGWRDYVKQQYRRKLRQALIRSLVVCAVGFVAVWLALIAIFGIGILRYENLLAVGAAAFLCWAAMAGWRTVELLLEYRRRLKG